MQRTSLTAIPSSLENLAERVDEWSVEARTQAAENPDLALARGHSLLNDGKLQEAIRTFDQALRRNPKHFDLLTGKATAHTLLEQHSQAADVYQRALAVNDGDPSAWFNYAVSLTRLKRFGPAAEAYRRALTLQPDYPKAAYNLAALCQQDGKLSEALTLWTRCTELAPQLGSAWFQRGITHLDLRQLADAARCFEQVTRLEPDRPDGWANLGVVRLELGMLDEAIEAMEKSVSLDPKQVSTQGLLGRAYAQRFNTPARNPRDREAAVRRFREALALDQNQPELQAALERIADQPPRQP